MNKNIIKRNNKKPEESVRKWIINYLIEKYGYKIKLFRVEKKIEFDLLNKNFRPDIVVYNNECKPFVIIECKAKTVQITEDTILQIVNYNKYINAKYILITNGINIFCWELTDNGYVKSEIPKLDSEI